MVRNMSLWSIIFEAFDLSEAVEENYGIIELFGNLIVAQLMYHKC